MPAPGSSSANLAAEVRKGMGQKTELGGYPHKAPLGYLNVREPIGGRQVAHIVCDPERARSLELPSSCTRRAS